MNAVCCLTYVLSDLHVMEAYLPCGLCFLCVKNRDVYDVWLSL